MPHRHRDGSGPSGRGRRCSTPGMTWRQTSMTCGQRAANGQPGGGSTSDGISPRASIRVRLARGDRGRRRAGVACRDGRAGDELLARRALDHPAGVHDDGAVADVAGAGDVVGDVEVGDAALVLEPLHQVEDAHPDRDIEHRDRLVGQEQHGIDGQGPRDGDALALTARELDAGTWRRNRAAGFRPTVSSSRGRDPSFRRGRAPCRGSCSGRVR